MVASITTIIPTFCRPLLLKRAVNSVLQQTYPHFQVCVYDNASGDETEEMMRAWVKKDDRIKYYRHAENIGMMANYQYAMDEIQTPYFSLLSDDDFLLSSFFETAMQGLQEYPDAAFSACSVLQLDGDGNFVGNPLGLWGTEGYYTAPEGLLEMIKTRWKFPVPTGVLFRTQLVKEVKPDFSKEIDFFWDPDYLLRIAARFPFVVSKKSCGVYLAHPHSFSHMFYTSIFSDITNAEKYFMATNKVMLNIENNLFLNAPHKRKAHKLFKNYVKGDIISFLISCIFNNKLSDAHYLAKKYYSYHGFSFLLVFFHLFVFLIKCCRVVEKTFKWLISKFSALLLRKSHLHSINTEEIQQHHAYGQELFKRE